MTRNTEIDHEIRRGNVTEGYSYEVCLGHISPRCSWCKDCTRDDGNLNCRYYHPVQIASFEVKEED